MEVKKSPKADLEGRKFKAPETNVLILGFSFKPDSDDIRNTKVADLYINLVGARLEKLHLASIRAGYKYLFVEPGRIGKAKVKEG